jgi:DNA-binding response OmpR family regulator
MERFTALVVDDDAALRLLSRVNLELEGFTVREAATAEEALEALAEQRPDVVLLDVHLGNEGSDSVLERARADRVPVLLVTGSADIDTYRGRADEVLPKPFTPDALIAAARRLASRVPAE